MNYELFDTDTPANCGVSQTAKPEPQKNEDLTSQASTDDALPATDKKGNA